jgi:hypothetical protein
MTFERSPGLPPEPGLPAPSAPSDGGTAGGPTPVQIRLQILTTEHWSLLASRNLAWNESFTRAGMYLTTLSATLVALGLIGGIDGFGDAFFVFALLILPIDLFVGFATLARMGAANYHDAMTVYGMNRIRGAYLQIAPDLEPFFIMGVHDDPTGISVTMAVPPTTPTIVHLLAATPFLVMVLNAVLAGAIVAVALVGFSSVGTTATLIAAFVAALVALVMQGSFARGQIRRGQGLVRPMFPTPTDDRPGA